jgi:hypothetical protein
MFGQARTWAIFLVGALCGAMIAIGIVWWKPHLKTTRSAEDNNIYDGCLMTEHGNTVACDAMMRLLNRGRLKKDAERALAAGFSKREVVQWAEDQGFGGSDVADAVGISLQDYQQGKY